MKNVHPPVKAVDKIVLLVFPAQMAFTYTRKSVYCNVQLACMHLMISAEPVDSIVLSVQALIVVQFALRDFIC